MKKNKTRSHRRYNSIQDWCIKLNALNLGIIIQNEDDIDWALRELYVTQRLTCSQICSKLDCYFAKETIAIHIRRIGITRRNREGAHNRKYTYYFQGKNRSLVEIAKITGLTYSALHKRLVVKQWDFERAVTQPMRKVKHGNQNQKR